MTKKYEKILLIFLLLFLANCSVLSEENHREIFIDNGKTKIKVNAEIADDNNERIIGLMFREKLEGNSGILFIFENEKVQTFWMKNTLIPLDIIYIDENYKIVDVKHAEPCKKDPCQLYRSSMPVKYVLEVNANFIRANNISIGDRIILNQ